MFEVSQKMQAFINSDCDMAGKLSRNLLKLFGGEVEFMQNYEAHIRKGIIYSTPHFNSTPKIANFWEENKVDCLIWAAAHAQECTQNHKNAPDWLIESPFSDKIHYPSVGDISAGLGNDKNDINNKTIPPTVFIMELAYQFCVQYKDFIIDFE